MEDRDVNFFYIGDNDFSERLLGKLFSKKGIKLAQCGADGASGAGDVLLFDSFSVLKKHAGDFKILVSNQPTKSPEVTFWCKSPVNENSLDNVLFYYPRGSFYAENNFSGFSARQVEAFIGDDQYGLQEVISEFIDNLSTNYRLLVHYFGCGDIRQFENVAHRMLSSVSYYEAETIREYLKDLENIDQLPAPDILEDLYGEVVRLRSGLIRKYF